MSLINNLNKRNDCSIFVDPLTYNRSGFNLQQKLQQMLLCKKKLQQMLLCKEKLQQMLLFFLRASSSQNILFVKYVLAPEESLNW